MARFTIIQKWILYYQLSDAGSWLLPLGWRRQLGIPINAPWRFRRSILWEASTVRITTPWNRMPKRLTS